VGDGLFGGGLSPVHAVADLVVLCDDMLVFSMNIGDDGDTASSSSLPSLLLMSGIFPSLADNGSSPGNMEPPELAEEIEPAYRCCYCIEVLRQPRQTPCGHRLCGPCVELLTQKNGSEPFHCPANEDGCLDMTIQTVCAVFSAERCKLHCNCVLRRP